MKVACSLTLIQDANMCILQDLHLDGDPTCLFLAAQALMTIQGVFGLIPNIYGKGAAAKQVYELMVRMRREMGGNEPQVSAGIAR